MLFGSKVTVTSTVCTVRLNARLSEVTVTSYLRTQIQESQLHKKCSVSLFNQSTHTLSLSLSVSVKERQLVCIIKIPYCERQQRLKLERGAEKSGA